MKPTQIRVQSLLRRLSRMGIAAGTIALVYACGGRAPSDSNAGVVENLNGIRDIARAEYADTKSYDLLCSDGSKSGARFRAAVEDSLTSSTSMCLSSGTGLMAAFGNSPVRYSATGKLGTLDQWGVSVALKTGGFYCVDYTGYAAVQPGRGIDNSPVKMTCH